MSTPKDAATDKTAGKEAAYLDKLPAPQVGSEPAADAFACMGGLPMDGKQPVEPPKPAEPSLKEVTTEKDDEPVKTPRVTRKDDDRTAPTMRGRSLASAAADHNWGRQDPPATEAKVILQNPVAQEPTSPWAAPTPPEEPKRVQQPLYKNPLPASSSAESAKEQARHADNEALYGGKLERATNTDTSSETEPATQRTTKQASRSTPQHRAKVGIQIVFALVLGFFLLVVGFVIRDGNLLVLTPESGPGTSSSNTVRAQPDSTKKQGLVPVTEETLKDLAKAHPGSGGTVTAWHWAGNDWHDRNNGYKDWPIDPDKVGLNCAGVKIRFERKDGFDTFDATNCKVSYPAP